MSSPLRLIAGVAVIPMGDAVQLRLGDERVHVLRSDPFDLALRLLDRLREGGERAAVVAALGKAQEHAVDELLTTLRDHGWLVRPGRDAPPARLAIAGHEPSVMLLAAIAGEHGIPASAYSAPSLEGATPGASVLACVGERPDLTLLYRVNDSACRLRKPCLFIDLSHGAHATLGPFFVPGEGACYRCMRTRLHENTAAHAELVAAEQHMLASGGPLPGPPVAAGHRHWALGMAATELAAWADGRPLRTLNRAITIDFGAMKTWSEPVWRIPWCNTCQ